MKALKKKDLWGLLVGMLLGNASITYTGNVKLRFKERDREYALEKKRLLTGNLTYWEEVSISEDLNEFKFYKSKFTLNVYKIVYLPTKYLTEKLVNHLTKQGLAIWYMDAGGLEFSRKNNRIANRRAYLDVSKWSLDEQKLLQNMLLANFMLETKLIKNRLYMNTTNTIKLINLIKTYIHESKRHMICLRYSKESNLNLCNSSCDIDDCMFNIKEML